MPDNRPRTNPSDNINGNCQTQHHQRGDVGCVLLDDGQSGQQREQRNRFQFPSRRRDFCYLLPKTAQRPTNNSQRMGRTYSEWCHLNWSEEVFQNRHHFGNTTMYSRLDTVSEVIYQNSTLQESHSHPLKVGVKGTMQYYYLRLINRLSGLYMCVLLSVVNFLTISSNIFS